jgi:hypothetical protein
MLLLAALGGCGRDGDAVQDGIRQTRLPGEVTAGGRTSGEVMAATTPAARPQPGPAGTPGIPRGAEGNTGGTAMGGTTPATTPGAASAGPAAAPTATGTGTASAPPAAAASAALAPASAASATALSDAQRQQLELVAAMDRVAAHWRARAAAQGRPVSAPTAVDSVGGIQASAIPTPAAQPPVRSEKLGTAAPSADVKQPTKPASDPGVNARAPDAAGPRP